MATIAITQAPGTEAGATLRALAKAIEQAASGVPDRLSSGGNVVLTIDNAPATGTASVVVSGPYPSGTITV